jgi:hypothetical protein
VRHPEDTELVSLSGAPPRSEERFVAVSFLGGAKCDVRVIGLSPRRVEAATGAASNP